MGISFRNQGQNYNYPLPRLLDLSQTPLLDYSALDLSSYPFGSVYSARGCNNTCTFCSLNVFWHYSYRAEPLDKVEKEIQQQVILGVKEIDFLDENLTQDLDRLYLLFERLSPFHLRFKGRSRLESLTPSLLDSMQEAGFYRPPLFLL